MLRIFLDRLEEQFPLVNRLVENSDILNQNNIGYMVVGAISVAIWGSPRTSQDLDVVLVLKDDEIKKFSDFCRKNKLSSDPEEMSQAFREKSHFTVFDDESAYRLDIKGVYDDLDKITFSRRTKVRFRDFLLWVNTPEDSILAKLVYGSPQDILDAKTMLLRQGSKLDMKYLSNQAKRFKVLNKLKSLSK